MSVSRLIVFLLVFCALVGGAHYYLWIRLAREPSWPSPWPRVITGVLVLGFGLLIADLMLLRSRTHFAPLAWAGFIWLGFFFFLFVGAVATHLAQAAAGAAVRLFGAAPVDPGRREAMVRVAAGVTGVLGVGLGISGLASALSRTAVKRVNVVLQKLPASANGYRIVQITDVHVGPMIDKVFIEEVVAQINALRPDAVVITGDLVDGSVATLERHVAPLRELVSKDGVYFVTGNHEYYSGAEEWIAHLGTLGIKVLRNERVELREGLHLAGIDDASAHQFGLGHGANLAKAVDGRDIESALVLLAHQPKAIFEAIRHGVDLQLSGHTHGGQMFPWNYMVRLQQPYNAGLFTHGDSNTQIYVSCGTGYWGPPMRVGAPAEITEIVLARA